MMVPVEIWIILKDIKIHHKKYVLVFIGNHKKHHSSFTGKHIIATPPVFIKHN